MLSSVHTTDGRRGGTTYYENYMICYLQVEEIEKFVNHYVLEGAGSIDKNGKTTFFSISCFY